MENGDHAHLRRTFELARDATDAGDEPFGSSLVADGEILVESHNTIATDDDVTAHPELKLARWGAQELSGETLADTTMYTIVTSASHHTPDRPLSCGRVCKQLHELL